MVESHCLTEDVEDEGVRTMRDESEMNGLKGTHEKETGVIDGRDNWALECIITVTNMISLGYALITDLLPEDHAVRHWSQV